MAKYSTNTGGSDSDSDATTENTTDISISINKWLKQALEDIIRKSNLDAQEAVRQSLEYAVVEWHRTLEQQSGDFEIPGEYIWDTDFRCLECKSANKFLFRRIGDDMDEPLILCLNCDGEMSREEATRLARAAEIQEMPTYTLSQEGTQLKHKYEGKYRTPMRFECGECNERGLTLPDPTKVDELICPRCGNKGKTLNQHKGPAVSNFVKYGPDKYHTTESPKQVGRDVSQGEYDHLEKAYRDGYDH